MSSAASRNRIGIAAVGWLWVAALAVAVAVLVNARIAFPLGFSDEFTYAALSARFGQESTLANNPLVVTLDAPNRLFLAIYGLLGSQPRPVFEMARALNSLLLAVGIGALFVAAREGRALGPSLVVAIAYGLGPQSTYTAYFTPETMYVVLFFLQTTFAALALSRQDFRFALLAGASAAMLSLVKPHGLPVAAVTFAFMAGYATLHRRSGARSLWLGCAVYLAALVALRLIVGRALAPDVVLGNALTGSLYSSFVGDMATVLADPERYAAVGRLVIAHLAAASCLAGPALVAGLAQVPGEARAESESARFAAALAGLTAWLLLALIVMTAVFTVAVEETNRLHLRYYAFCIPLLLVGLAALEAVGLWTRRQQLLGLAAWVSGIAVYELFVADYLRSPFDAAELFFRPWVMPGVPLAGAAIALLAYRSSSRALLGAVLGVYLVMSALAMVFDRQFQSRTREAAEHRAARVAVALADAANAPLVIVAPEADRFGLPYVYRIASFATHRANFLGLRAAGGHEPERLAEGTVVVGKRDALAAIGVAPLIEVEAFGVARIGPAAEAAPASAQCDNGCAH
jgi:phosphoglycerol transferase